MRRAVALLVVAVAIAGAPAAGADEPGYTTKLAPPPSRVGALSADGTIAAVDSANAVVVIDRRRGTRTRIVAGDGATSTDAMSADGRWLVLASTDSTLPQNRHGDRVRHLYLHDRRAGTTTLLTVRPDGSPATDASFGSGISDDGRVVAFSSRDTALASPAPGPGQLVFVSAYARDVITGVTTKAPAGNESGAGAITPDGRYVLYIDGVISASVHTGYRLYRWDRVTGAGAEVSKADGRDVRYAFRGPISPDGRWILFEAVAPTGGVWLRDMRVPDAKPLFLAGRPMAISADGRSAVLERGRAGPSGVPTTWTVERADLLTGATTALVSGQGRATAISRDRLHVGIETFGGAFVRDVGLQYPCDRGYRLIASDGGVFAFGNATFHGSTGSMRLNQPIVAAMATPSGRGYWLVAADGGVFTFGDARFHGSAGGLRLARPIVSAAATPAGDGYWLLASDGGVFAFGGARFHGRFAFTDNEATAIVTDPSGGGYWVVARDGRIAAFGDAPALPRTPGGNILAAAATPSGRGLWVAAADGDVFATGDARYLGGGPKPSNGSVVGLTATPTGAGYRLVAADGGVFSFGDARFCGSTGSITLNRPIVAAAG